MSELTDRLKPAIRDLKRMVEEKPPEKSLLRLL